MAKAPKKLVEALQTLKSTRVEAAILAHLLKNTNATTADLLAQTGLRQPEVSIGMKKLREANFIEVATIPRDGKGRPMNRYTLTQSKPQVVKMLKARADAEISQIKSAVDVVKSA